MTFAGRAILTLSIALTTTGTLHGAENAIDELLERYRASGAGAFSAATGASAWRREVAIVQGEPARSCMTCHGKVPAESGKHINTGKNIDPMAPSVNRKRLTSARKIEKWFKRNCKWSWGRECTPQEKGDFLSYLRDR